MPQIRLSSVSINLHLAITTQVFHPSLIRFPLNPGYLNIFFEGSPKGIMLSHENIISCACACIHQLDGYAPNKTDVMISYLPLAHMLERACQVGWIQSTLICLFRSNGMVCLTGWATF